MLVFLEGEPGGDRTRDLLFERPAVSTLILQELISRLVRAGMASEHARRIGRELNLEGHDLSWELAEDAGTMIVATRPYGLSHGDRACLALARKLAVPAITADKAWAKVANEIGVEVEVIR